MAKTEKQRAQTYRDQKTENHKRIGPWFHDDELDVIDSIRGDDSRTTWLHKTAMRSARRKTKRRAQK